MAEQTKALAPSARFSALVVREYENATTMGTMLTDTQKRLVQNYFIAADNILRAAEEKRVAKNAANRDHKYDVTLAYIWDNVAMNAFALDCAFYARMGLDPLQKNHVFIIPFKNKHTGKYDMTFMEGYVGKEVIASKYALDPVLDVTCELVYSSDSFIMHKKSADNRVESYDFEIRNPFDRGQVVGGFGYIQYEKPEKNQLIVLSMRDIEKRKASGQGNAEFWGGEKTVWENGKRAGTEKVEGWFDEMCLKTVKRAVYGSIPIDSTKIDEAYEHIKRREAEFDRALVSAEIEEHANKGAVIDIAPDDVTDAEYTDVPPGVDAVTGEVLEGAAEPEASTGPSTDSAIAKGPPTPPEEVICGVCGKPVLPQKGKDGTMKTPAQVKEALGGMCAACYRKEQAKGKKAAPPVAADDGQTSLDGAGPGF